MVFAREDGSPLHPELLSELVEPDLRAAGLPRIRFHDLGHTYASVSLQEGISPRIVSERSGHSSTGITLDVYSHLLPGLQEEAAARVATRILG